MPDGGACTNPLPGVVRSAPRLARNVVNGVAPTVVVAPPPSQLISRRPVACAAPLPLLMPPSAALNWSTAPRMAAAVGPAAWNTVGASSLRGELPCASAVVRIGAIVTAINKERTANTEVDRKLM